MTVDSYASLQVGDGSPMVSQVIFTGAIPDNGTASFNPFGTGGADADIAANSTGNGIDTLNGTGIVFSAGNNSYGGSMTSGSGNALYIEPTSSLPTGNTIINNGILAIVAFSSSSKPMVIGNISGGGSLIVGMPPPLEVMSPFSTHLKLAANIATSIIYGFRT
jgi:hypothetical protein